MSLVPKLLLTVGLLLVTSAGRAAQTQAELLLSHDAARAADSVTAAVRLRMPARWHTYWQTSGESGAPTTIEWTLPAGVTAGEIQWPVPEKYSSAGLITFVYHNEAVLLVPLTIGANAAAGSVEIKAAVAWLECDELCLPGKAEVSAQLTLGTDAKPSAHTALFDAARKKLPEPKPVTFARAAWEKPGSGDVRPLTLAWAAASSAFTTDFYPGPSDKFGVKPAVEKLSPEAGRDRLRKEVEKIEGDWPSEISGLLIEKDAKGELLAAYQVKLPIEDSSVSAPAQFEIEKKPLLAWLGLAFLGGLILNLMPCVLPVIALKIFGFVAQSHVSPGRTRILGVCYGLGVLFSFLVLAGLIIALISAGKQVGWGVQFGNPYFLVAMTVLMTLVALNFFGLFEVTLGGGAMNAAAGLAAKEGVTGAFFNGLLTTALATPCVAPFMAQALGFAFAQPPKIILLVFVCIALGLALPYVVLSFSPKLVKFLPKPGPWMGRFKMAMGFPMLVTGVWLFSILTRHYGQKGVLWIGIFLVLVAVAAWIWGEFVQRGTRRRWLAMALSVFILGGGYVLALEMGLHWRTRQAVDGGAAVVAESGGIPWEKWSRTAVGQARAAGRPILIDFTADWCPNCIANKKTSIEVPSVRAKLKELNAVSLLGDYTLTPDDITAELKHFGRAGVPLVLVYPKDAAKPPEILPALLKPSIVLEALDRAGK